MIATKSLIKNPTKVNQCEILHFMYFQESRFGSLNVVFVEKRSFIDEISIQNDNECVEATALYRGQTFC